MKPTPDNVKKAIGATRIAALENQPLCIAAGGLAEVLRQACEGAATLPQAVCRALQLCGSQPGEKDRNA